MTRFTGLDPAATKATLEKIITGIQARGLPILLAGMEAPRNLGKDYVEAFRALYQDLAERHDVILYPFFLDGVALDEKLIFSGRDPSRMRKAWRRSSKASCPRSRSFSRSRSEELAP